MLNQIENLSSATRSAIIPLCSSHKCSTDSSLLNSLSLPLSRNNRTLRREGEEKLLLLLLLEESDVSAAATRTY